MPKKKQLSFLASPQPPKPASLAEEPDDPPETIAGSAPAGAPAAATMTPAHAHPDAHAAPNSTPPTSTPTVPETTGVAPTLAPILPTRARPSWADLDDQAVSYRAAAARGMPTIDSIPLTETDPKYMNFHAAWLANPSASAFTHPAAAIVNPHAQSLFARRLTIVVESFPSLIDEDPAFSGVAHDLIQHIANGTLTFSYLAELPPPALLAAFCLAFLRPVSSPYDPAARFAASFATALAQSPVRFEMGFVTIAHVVISTTNLLLPRDSPLYTWATSAGMTSVRNTMLGAFPDPFADCARLYVNTQDCLPRPGDASLREFYRCLELGHVAIQFGANCVLQERARLERAVRQPQRAPRTAGPSPAPPTATPSPPILPSTTTNQTPNPNPNPIPPAASRPRPPHQNLHTASGWQQVPAPRHPSTIDQKGQPRGAYVCQACKTIDAAATGVHAGCSNHLIEQCVRWDIAGVPASERVFANLHRLPPP